MCFSDDLANKKPVQVMGSFIKAFGISLSLNKQNAARIKEEDVPGAAVAHPGLLALSMQKSLCPTGDVNPQSPAQKQREEFSLWHRGTALGSCLAACPSSLGDSRGAARMLISPC